MTDALAVKEYQVIRNKLIEYFVHKGRSDADELFDRVVDIVVGKIETCETCPEPSCLLLRSGKKCLAGSPPRG